MKEAKNKKTETTKEGKKVLYVKKKKKREYNGTREILLEERDTIL